MADDMSAAGKGAYSDYKFVDKQELDTWVFPFSKTCLSPRFALSP
jgi:hypothetical protein